MCLHLFWQPKRLYMHKKLNNFRATIDNTSRAYLKKYENYYSTGSRKNPWLYICKENTLIYLETWEITPKI